MTYLVTGGAGFIGSNFILYLLKTYPDARVINADKLTYAGNLENLRDVADDPRYWFIRADVCDPEAVGAIFNAVPVDVVVHFAAESHVDRSIADPNAFVQNVAGTVNLLNHARAAWQTGEDTYRPGVKFLQVSTDEVYGSLGAEGFFTEETPLRPHSPYAASKAAADHFVLAFGDTYRLPVNITRCSNNYGPFQFPEKMIPLMFHNAMEGKPLPVYGDGGQVRDWLFVEDHCKAIDRVATAGAAGEVYNVGGHNERTNLDLVKGILAFVRANGNPAAGEHLIRHVTDRKGHDRRYGIDPSKIKRELGWSPETAFDAGMEKTLRWYLTHPGWMERAASGAYLTYYETMYGER